MRLMEALLQPVWDHVIVFALVLTRISGLVMVAPFLGARTIPIRVRGLLAVGLAMMLTPVNLVPAGVLPQNLLEMSVALARELILGLSWGVSLTILFAGLQLAGHIIGQMTGMSLADVYDPSFDTSVPIFAKLLDIVSLTVFICIGGHREVVRTLLDTFRSRPPGTADFSAGLIDTLTVVAGESFVLGLRVAAPVMVALLMSIVIMGLISRTLPQLNILAVGFSLNSLVTMGTLMLSMGALGWVVQERADAVLQLVHTALIP